MVAGAQAVAFAARLVPRQIVTTTKSYQILQEREWKSMTQPAEMKTTIMRMTLVKSGCDFFHCNVEHLG